jgi:phosphorylase kinase alpha/beta subunit
MTPNALPIIRNPQIAPLMQPEYTAAQLAGLMTFLHKHKVFHFPPLGTGLFSAALVTSENEVTGYKSAWVRDNVHILNAHLESGDRMTAERGAISLCRFFHRYRQRIETILENPRVATDENNRPHIRFDGETLTEIDTPWAHAQNDAIGYFLWLWAARCPSVNDPEHVDLIHPVVEPWEKETVSLLLQYLYVIQYWQDEDSGHWEEERKISASSIGAVVAALRRLQTLEHVLKPSEIVLCQKLLEHGQDALNRILPYECIQPEPGKKRLYDAALLFLIYPLAVTDEQQSAQIAANVRQHLLGPHGIKRYVNDSFYCANYESHFPLERLTSDYSMCMDERDAFFRDGGEAQWTIFDPILSVYFGRMYRKTGNPEFRRLQCLHLNRSLGQITGPQDRYGLFHCPELYYNQDGRIQTSRSTPLLWTQANLLLALNEMQNG